MDSVARYELLGMLGKPYRRLTAVLALLAFPAVAVAEGPSASFSASPENPRSGDGMSFASSSCDPDGRLVSEAWDLDGDGEYDDAEGHAVGTTFTAPGAHLVGLRVMSADGASAVQRRTIVVDTVYALPRPDSARALSPFPVVTLAGRLTSRGARIKLLRISAPVCSRIRVTCRGRGCPSKRVSKYAGRKASRIRRLERSLRAGSVVTVRVSKGDRIGKLTTFRIRLHKEPARRDMCLKPGDSKGSRCPRG
jgi:PKD repeat protein